MTGVELFLFMSLLMVLVKNKQEDKLKHKLKGAKRKSDGESG